MKATYAGHRFGFWSVLRQCDGLAHKYWLCRCDCGTEKILVIYDLKQGKSMSCGCQRRRLVSKAKIKHGANTRTSRTREYKIWLTMMTRCRNPKRKSYPSYGGRGIDVCERWEDFAKFLEDVGLRPSPKHSLERIDNNRGYEPGNVRWATIKEQTRNTRQNVFLTHNGKTQCLTDWASELGIAHTTLSARIRRLGWSIERALTTPAMTHAEAGRLATKR